MMAPALIAGGLAGRNNGAIRASYATGAVGGGDRNIGGLAGDNGGSIINSYATGSVASPYQHGGGLIGPIYAGGLVGRGDGGSSIKSYWDTETSGLTTSAGGIGLTTAELQRPTGATGIYASWNPAWWDFGTSEQYPVLKVEGLSVAAQR